MYSYGAKSFDVVGFIYNSEIWCPDCVIKALVIGHDIDKAVLLLATDMALNAIAAQLGIDHLHEDTYDSDDFPKVVFADQVESADEVCCWCEEPLIPEAGDGWVNDADEQVDQDPQVLS